MLFSWSWCAWSDSQPNVTCVTCDALQRRNPGTTYVAYVDWKGTAEIEPDSAKSIGNDLDNPPGIQSILTASPLQYHAWVGEHHFIKNQLHNYSLMISAATNDYYVHNSSESIKASCTSIFVLPNGGKKCRRYRRYPMEVLLALHLGNSEEHFGVQHRKSFSVARANPEVQELGQCWGSGGTPKVNGPVWTIQMWSYLAISRVGDGRGLPENI